MMRVVVGKMVGKGNTQRSATILLARIIITNNNQTAAPPQRHDSVNYHQSNFATEQLSNLAT